MAGLGFVALVMCACMNTVDLQLHQLPFLGGVFSRTLCKDRVHDQFVN